jgi:2-polyprenyl-3-methyl-5-hydroxy-6-metoxy-1,4-benzoquinol methylase
VRATARSSQAPVAESRLRSYTGRRPDILALVGEAPRRVLDVGCATGELGADLKERFGSEVWGVEPDSSFSRSAGDRLDHLIPLPLEEGLARLAGQEFDLIVCADVLEHLDEPLAALRQLRPMLGSGGRCIVSLPNVRFYETFVQLAFRGTWPRRERGLFDRTHKHWFTDADARALFAEAGFDVERAASNYRLRDRPGRLDRLARIIGRGPLRPFLAYQHLYRLAPAPI